MRRAARRDDNEAIIIEALEAAGCSVTRLSARGVPDLLVGRFNRNLLLEVIGEAKAKKYRATGGRTPAQVEFEQGWNGQVDYVSTVREALAVMEWRLR